MFYWSASEKLFLISMPTTIFIFLHFQWIFLLGIEYSVDELSSPIPHSTLKISLIVFWLALFLLISAVILIFVSVLFWLHLTFCLHHKSLGTRLWCALLWFSSCFLLVWSSLCSCIAVIMFENFSALISSNISSVLSHSRSPIRLPITWYCPIDYWCFVHFIHSFLSSWFIWAVSIAIYNIF